MILNNLCGSETVMHLVTAGVKNHFVFKNKTSCRTKKVSTLNLHNLAFFTFKKTSDYQKKVFTLNLCGGKKGFGN